MRRIRGEQCGLNPEQKLQYDFIKATSLTSIPLLPGTVSAMSKEYSHNTVADMRMHMHMPLNPQILLLPQHDVFDLPLCFSSLQMIDGV